MTAAIPYRRNEPRLHLAPPRATGPLPDGPRKAPPVIDDVTEHTMEDALHQYLDIKIHHWIDEAEYDQIVVVGQYDRTCEPADNEKGGKIFNWQRPTAEMHDGTLVLKAAPGFDYVMHYGSLVASYLALNDRDPNIVSYTEPTEDECWRFIAESNLADLELSPVVVYGSGMPRIGRTSEWRGAGPFRIARKRVNGTDVTFLGCEYCVWGDIAGRLVAYTAAHKGVERFVYVGKLGSIHPDHDPNRVLATGNSSFVNGELVEWDSVFENIRDDGVASGVHYTSPSPMLETKSWLDSRREYDFVDPEIGNMGKAAADADIQYGYMHVVSNNLTRVTEENLSNERERTIVDRRNDLKDKIRKFVERAL